MGVFLTNEEAKVFERVMTNIGFDDNNFLGTITFTNPKTQQDVVILELETDFAGDIVGYARMAR